MKILTNILLSCLFCCIASTSSAQGVIYRPPIVRVQPTLVGDTTSSPITTTKFYNDTLIVDSMVMRNRPKTMRKATELDTLLNQLKAKLESPDFYNIEVDTTIKTLPIPIYFFRQPVFCGYDANLDTEINTYKSAQCNTDSSLTWLNQKIQHNRHLESIKQKYMINHPQTVRYNMETLPIAPKRVFSKIDPRDSKITVQQQDLSSISTTFENAEIKRRNWLHSFNGSLQFSQAYNSPNWYQGGNNNLNMLLNAEFNIKLNEAFHPNLLFETNIKYKLAMNSAPEDTIRDYSISDDIFQINSKFGVRAAKRWFYSVQVQFKTQLLNGYKTNTNDLKASFLSPGELNVGLGMTYNYANEKKTFTFDASVSPLSYNMKTCTNWRMDETAFGIHKGKKTVSEMGSSGEAKLNWRISHNISLATRLFAFTDYSYFQGDLENTLSFAINRFLSTQINVNLRYDTSVPSDIKWHKLQLKEILSFGFAYSFKNL